MDLDRSRLDEALRTLGALLEERPLPLELVAIGGSSLMLLGLLDRATRDIDIVALVRDGRYRPASPLPTELVEAVADVGRALGLAEDWLNAGPASLLDFGLPEGFEDRVRVRRYGALTLRIADRADQICFKVYAAVDQGPDSKHLSDLNALDPTREELLRAGRWAVTHDPSPAFRAELLGMLRHMGVHDAEPEL